MNRNYKYWISQAVKHKMQLEDALDQKKQKDIIYFRGKYLFDLKQAHKLNKNIAVPASINGTDTSMPIEDVINMELKNHQETINKAIKTNKADSDIKNNTLFNEIKLKSQRLTNRISQVKYSSNDTKKSDIAKDSFGLIGSIIKTPLMVTAKVASAVGPLIIKILELPVALIGHAFIGVDAKEGTVVENVYNNTVVHKLSTALQDGIQQISNSVYKVTGRI